MRERIETVSKAYVLETLLGPMAILGDAHQIRESQLPAVTYQALIEEVHRSWGCAVDESRPAWIRELEHRVNGLWQGIDERFLDLKLDLTWASPFQSKVYKALRKMRPAQVASYGDLALLIGSPRGARAVGGALRKNRIPLFIPCHRILAQSGIGGFTAPGGLEQKYKLLRAEGWQS